MGNVFSAPSSPDDRAFKKGLHGVLMLWSWGFCLPGGVALATWGRQLLGDKGVWFKTHRALGYAGVAMALAGMLIGRAVATGRESASSHRLIGYAVTLLGFAQPIIAYYRPEPVTDEQKALKAKGEWAPRANWFLLHKWLGWLCIALGFANIRLGLKMFDPSSVLSSAYAAGVVAIGGGAAAWNIAALM